jgi:putative tryptophan/tyrosine transport system substrate-binding protein
MKRRSFLGLLAGSMASGAAAQGPPPARVGLVSLPIGEGSPLHGWWGPFFGRMNAHGYVEGRTVLYDATRAGGRADLLEGAIEGLLARHKPDILVSTGLRETRAAVKVAPNTPTVMFLVPDAVDAGLVETLARPGRNVTGLNTRDLDVEVKRLELLLEFVPDARRLGVLGVAGQAEDMVRHRARAVERAARLLGIEIVAKEAAANEASLEETFRAMRSEGVAGVSVLEIAEFYPVRRLLSDLAIRHRLPAIFGQRDYVVAGGLAGYMARLGDLQSRAADYVVRILRGERPETLPVERPTSFQFVINMRTAQSMGVAVAPRLLARADEVIE